MKKAKKIIAFALVLVMAAALLNGCGETGSTGSIASGKTYNLAYQCAWGSGGGPFQSGCRPRRGRHSPAARRSGAKRSSAPDIRS